MISLALVQCFQNFGIPCPSFMLSVFWITIGDTKTLGIWMGGCPNLGDTKITGVTEQIDVSFSCVCPVIDHEFCHNIVKVAVDPRGNS